MEKLYRLPEVKATTGLSKSTIYAAILAGDFPEPVKIGVRAVAWRESDLERWASSRSTPGGRAKPAAPARSPYTLA